jgi:predicted GIY-YIG superfamily endonuclease
MTSKGNTRQYVYIIQCSDDTHYVGCTNNLERRLNQHQNGKVKCTYSRRPIELVTYVTFNNKYLAYRFEKYLKTGSGRAFMYKRFVS